MPDLALAIAFVASITGLPTPPTPVLVEDKAILEELCPNNTTRNPVGLYCKGFIWLRDDATQATLVHEVTHHFQLHYPTQMKELQAYAIERQLKR